MAENMFIKFDPEKIADVATIMENLHGSFVRCTDSIRKKSESVANNWQSESALLYIDKMRGVNIQSDEMSKILLSFTRDLLNVSGVYRAGESNAKQKAEALPTDGVFLV